MKNHILIYLLTKHKNESIKKFPETARFVSSAYNNVINKINDCGNSMSVNKIDNLGITNHMKDKLKYLLTKKLSPTDEKKIKQSYLYNNFEF